MPLPLRLVVYSTLLTWIMLMVAATLRSRSWSPRGVLTAMGNRDDLPEPSPLAARADRAAKNMLENLLLFATLVVVAHLVEADEEKTKLGARLFFWARLAYFPIYLAGVKVLRTIVWGVGVAGMLLIAQAVL
jgi:uncharacterized MAPEG superfamily protein